MKFFSSRTTMSFALTFVFLSMGTLALAQSDEYGNKARINARIQECSASVHAYCSDMPKCEPAYAISCSSIDPKAYYKNCTDTLEQNMFDPVDKASDLHMTLSPPNGNLYGFIYGVFKATYYLPVPDSLAEPLISCLLNGKKGMHAYHAPKPNPCDEPPNFTVTRTYDENTNYCNYQMTNHSVYQENCQIAGHQVAPFPGKSGGWSLPGQCDPNAQFTCSVYPTNPNGYSYNNKICIVADQPPLQPKQAEKPKPVKPKPEKDIPGETWTDPATGLMWTLNDNGSNINWSQANNYCANLHVGDYSGWRLATNDELHGIYDPSVNKTGQCCGGQSATWHVKGNIQLTGEGAIWSSSSGNGCMELWNFGSSNGGSICYDTKESSYLRVICVRRPGQ